MAFSRLLFISVLSITCLAIFLFYTIIPQGPQLLWNPESLNDYSTASEMKTQAEKFTPE